VARSPSWASHSSAWCPSPTGLTSRSGRAKPQG
jgi:hypothetical protein